MRPLIIILSWTLLFCGTPAWAERQEGIESTRLELEGEGETKSEAPDVERPWLRPPFDAQLAQAGEETLPEDIDARIAELRAQRAGISKKWPTAGVIAGSALTTIGAATLSLNTFCDWAEDWDDDDDDDDDDDWNCTGGWVAGGILVGGGLTLLGTSGWILVKRTRERRAIDREIERLKNGTTARRTPSWSVGFDVGERKGVRFAWRY